MHKKYTLFILIILLAGTAKAQSSVIPDISYPYLEKLIAAAKSNYPRVTNYNDKVDLAKINVNRAKLTWFDLFTFSYIYQPNNTTVVNTIPVTSTSTANNRYLFNGLQAGVSVNLGSLLLKPSTVKVAQQDLKIANDEQSEYMITLTALVKSRYFTYLLQQNLVKVQTQSYQDMQSSIIQAKSKFQKGEANFETYNAALLMSADRTTMKLQAEANFFIAKSELEALVGVKLEDIK
jgi:outer membrane protein TolC